MKNGIATIGLSIGLFLYFLPSIVGSARQHHNQLAIVMLNLFLGWTLLGWVLALVWACTATTAANGRAAQ